MNLHNSVKLLITFLLAASFAAFFMPAANAQKVGCPPREQLMQSLNAAGMQSVWIGMSHRGHLTEIMMNMASEEKLWVAIVHLNSNHSCVVDQGVQGNFVVKGNQRA